MLIIHERGQALLSRHRAGRKRQSQATSARGGAQMNDDVHTGTYGVCTGSRVRMFIHLESDVGRDVYLERSPL